MEKFSESAFLEALLSQNTIPPQSLPPVNFLRRIYFERDSLHIVAAYHMERHGTVPTVEEDWQQYPSLVEYEGDRDNVDVLEWGAPDHEVEEVCSNAAWIGLRRTGDGEKDYEVFDDSEYLKTRDDPNSEIAQLLDLLEEKVQTNGLSVHQMNRLTAIQRTLEEAALSPSTKSNTKEIADKKQV